MGGCIHYGQTVRVGKFEILAGGVYYLQPEDLETADILVPLAGEAPFAFGRRYEILAATLEDFGGVPDGWRQFLEGEVIPELGKGRRLLVFCKAGHGRTGMFLASLIALLESREETPDPIAAVRERYCQYAVEVDVQGEAVFALRGEPLPDVYREVLLSTRERRSWSSRKA